MDIGTAYGGLVTPPPLPAPPPLDPTAALLDTPVGRLVEGHSGDAASALGVLGATLLVVNHRGASMRSAALEAMAGRIVTGAIASAAVDTAIQSRNLLLDGPGDAEARGAEPSTLGTIAYAATGVIPAASMRALRGAHLHASRSEVVALTALGANAGVLGYEVVTRVPRMLQGEEDLSGYGSFVAAAGGFVVARKLTGR